MSNAGHHYYYAGRQRPNAIMGKAFDPVSLFAGGESGAIYDVSDLSSMFEERAGGGTTPSSVNGVVGTIRDKSGLGNHWVAVADAARPILKQSGSIYYLDTDSTDDRMTATFGVPLSIPLTRMACIRQVTWVSGDRVLHGGVGSSYLGQNNSTPQLSIFNATWGALNGGATVGAFAVTTERFGTSGTSGAGLTVNNGAETTHTGTYAAHTTISMSDGASFGDIDYAALIIINRALTPTETANARTWLGTRGGLSL